MDPIGVREVPFAPLSNVKVQEWNSCDTGRLNMSASSMDGTESVDRAALAGMLKGYDADQLVEEVLSAWGELSTKNGEIASVKQRNRVLELDLAEREDLGAPEKARLGRLDEEVRDKEARIIHLERMLEDSRGETKPCPLLWI